MGRKKGFIEFPINNDEAIYTTGVISKLLSIPQHVLKKLDQEGIVKPPRKMGRSRLYSKRELKKIQKCWEYIKGKGVNMPGLKIILEMKNMKDK